MVSVKRIAPILISLLLMLTMMPAAAFADDGTAAEDVTEAVADEISDEETLDEEESGYEEFALSEHIGPDEIITAEPEKLLEEFLISSSDVEEESEERMTPEAPLSKKGDRLTGNNLKYYDYFRNIIKKVSAGNRITAVKKVYVSSFLGKRKFTAKELGVKKIGYKKNGKWYVTKAAKKKVEELLGPENWKKVYQSLLSDLSTESYWVDWYTKEQLVNLNCPYTYNEKYLTFDRGDWIEFSLPVIPEFRKAKNSWTDYVYKVDSSKIKAANTAKQNARDTVKTVDDYIRSNYTNLSPAAYDYLRLWYYCQIISYYTEYDWDAYYSSQYNDTYWRGPWSLISVFDNDPSTKTVCAGYARAYKYLCDLTKFKSKWIDCQIASGDVTGDNGREAHMWNIVRMNDGLNYLVDPTWADDDTSGEVDELWFLRGAPGGTTKSFTVEGSKRKYDAWMIKAFAPAERKLSSKDKYELTDDRPIVLSKTRIKSLKGAKKAFTVKWKKVSSPLGALYVDGYQIRYSTKRNMSGARAVKIKGYAKSSKKIRKLKQKKRYYVQVRTYAKVGGTTVYSKWSSRKRVKTK